MIDIEDQKHQIALIFIVGLIAFLLHTALSAIFIVALPQADDWCKDYYDDGEGYGEPTTFKNTFEELKYHHNKQMVKRNTWLIAFGCGFWGLVTYLFLRWKRGHGEILESDILGMTIAFTLAVALVMPLIYSWVLPSPAKWFPAVFAEINQVQVDAKLEELKADAQILNEMFND